nr:hypothetical protein [Tanacetum cinerariifolium]
MYKEYLAKFWYSAIALDNSKVSFSIPSGGIYGEGMNEGTKNTLYDYLFTGTDPHVLADQTKSVSEGLETVIAQPRTGKRASSVARQIKEEEASSTIKLKDLAKLVLNVQPSFKDLDSPEDDPVIVVDDSDEDEEDEVHATTNVETEDTSSQKHKLELEKNKVKDEAALLKAQPFFPNVGKLNELLVKSLQTEFSKILAAHDFSSLLPTELKDLPSKFNELTEEIKGLKKQVHKLEIELPKDLKEIPSKLEDFTKTVTSLTSQFTDLKTIQWELLVEFLLLPVQVASAQEEEAKAKAAKREGEMRKEKLIDLLGPKVVNKYCNDKLQYDRYCDKMLNRRAKSKITNYDILTKKGPITLKYIEKMIQVKSFLSSKRVTYILEKMDYLRTTEAKPGIDLDRPLSEQDPLDKRNDLANKKRKHADDIHDLFKANKRLKSSVQF